MKAPSNGFVVNSGEGEKRIINSELWHACAGPLVSLPPVGTLVVYFPQGHSEQIAASMQKKTDSIPNYPSLPSKLICVLHNATLHADAETDEVYAQMTLQPVNKEALLASDLGLKQNKQPTEFFCKTLTASDTSTHGGFSVPRRAADKIFPPLDFSMQPPAQELVAKDLHDVTWTFRHVYRGQPKRHLLTTGWSVFVSTKRLFAGDSVLFIRDDKSQLLLGIRHANSQQPALSSSVLSSDSMHIGILAAAAHAAANDSPFTIFYNPRASPSEFVIPLAKYKKSMYTQVSLGMRFRMMFETEESGVQRYMGTITGISDLDPVRWKNSQWHNLQVGWDESTAGERRNRVSIWEIEPMATPFYICPPPFFRPKFPKHPGMPDDESEVENAFKRAIPWLGDDIGLKDAQGPIFPGLSLVQWMSMQQNPQLIIPAAQSGYFPSMVASALQNTLSTEDPARILNFQAHALSLPNLQFNVPKSNQPIQQVEQFQQTLLTWPQQQPQQTPIHLEQQQQQQQIQHSPIHPQQQQQQQKAIHLLQPHQQQTPIHMQQQNAQQPEQQQQLMPIHPQQQQSQQQQLRPATVNPVVVDQQQQKQLQPFVGQPSPQYQPFVNQLLKSPQHQLQQQSFPTPYKQVQQNLYLFNQNSLQPASSTHQNSHFQQQMEQQQGLSQMQQQLQQTQQVPLCQPQIQLQQKQVLSQLSPCLENQLLEQQLAHQQFQQQHSQQQLQVSSTQFSPPPLKQQVSSNHIVGQLKPQLSVRTHSMLRDNNAPSCLTLPSSNGCRVSSSNLLNRTQQGPAMLAEETAVQLANDLVQEHHRKLDTRAKHELHCTKEPDQLEYRPAMTDQLDASSFATSFCLDGSAQKSFSFDPICLDGEIQVDPRNNFGANIDGLMPDTLLSGFGSGKDLQNLLSGCGNRREIETELSTAAISSQPSVVPDISFKPGCSSDTAVNENGVLNRGLWANQPQRMRTYTKVQKRGFVGRCIDVTRYKGYDELRHDLACMFGFEGQFEDPYRTDWKLVYVDHENDILLVGDDPWEEFINCVQSIKILSAAEVQQMSLNGDLACIPAQNQACSGSAHYDDNSAASFNC